MTAPIDRPRPGPVPDAPVQGGPAAGDPHPQRAARVATLPASHRPVGPFRQRRAARRRLRGPVAAASPGSDGPPVRPLAAVIGAVAGGAVGGVTAAVVGAAAGALVAVVARRLRRAGPDVVAELPVLCDEVSRSLRSGATPLGALAEGADAVEGPLRAALHRTVGRVRAGAELGRELDRLVDEIDDAGLDLLVGAVRLGYELGGDIADVVDLVGDSARDRVELRAEARSAAGPARTSMVLMTALPLLFVLVVGRADPRLPAFLTDTPLGLVCLVGGLTLDGAAFLAAELLTRRAMP